MKYLKMKPVQQEAVRDTLTAVLVATKEQEQRYTQTALRLLLVGNAAGIALLAAFMGSLVGSEADLTGLVEPFKFFLAGTLLGGFTYLPLFGVASEAPRYLYKQIEAFYLNEKQFQDVQNYGLNRLGSVLVGLLMLGSLGCFLWACWLSLGAVEAIAAALG